MKKIFYLGILALLGLTSCEKDDFCTSSPVTPNLVLRFYDNSDQTKTKNVSRLSIIAQGKTDSLVINQSLDSIAIPLNSAATTTVYTLKINEVDGKIANNQISTLTINYKAQEEYVSRSCGYRYIFNNVTVTAPSGTWIQSLTPTDVNTIDNQSRAHVKIYH